MERIEYFVPRNRCIVLDVDNLEIVEYKDIPSDLEVEIDDYIINWKEKGYYVISPEVDIDLLNILDIYRTKKYLNQYIIFES